MLMEFGIKIKNYLVLFKLTVDIIISETKMPSHN